MTEYKFELPLINFTNLENSIKFRYFIEILHNMGIISNKIYYFKYDNNAEALDHEISIWSEIQKIDRIIAEYDNIN